MNGRKPTKPRGGSGSSSQQSLPIRWVNIALTAEDVDILSRETADLQQLALAYISLGAVGFGLSVKYDSVGKSYNCCIYGPDNTNNMQPCGVSGKSPDLRDALLVLLYRFNNRLQGSFDGQSSQDTVLQSRRFQ